MTAQLVEFPTGRPFQMRTVTLLTLQGAPFATAGFLPGDPGAPWAWICECVAREWGVEEDAVGTLEPHEDEGGGDFITVDGLPAYRVQIGRNAVGGASTSERC